jgi:hypothetical protein
VATQAAYRAAAVTMLTDCAANASVKLQVYRARPQTLYPPSAFVDTMADSTEPFPGSSTLYQHTPLVELTLVWGLFDSGEAVDQRDAFVDAYHDWVRARPHQAGANTLIGPRSLNDIPVYNPDWGNEDQRQRSYYATRIVLEGFATD